MMNALRVCALAFAAGVAVSCAAPACRAAADGPPVAAAVADFDNHDTSGESSERNALHAARVEAFAEMLRERLARDRGFHVVRLDCQAEHCSPATVPADDLIRAAREAGARILVYGGVHKMSTLVQFGKVQAVDLATGRVILDRSISFRGDTDEAFRRAADFIAGYLENADLGP